MLHNTILASRTYPSLIEYRFAGTTGAVIANNLLDGSILARDGARATVTGNVTNATADMFVNPTTGDLRLKPTATAAIDRAPAVANCPLDWEGTYEAAGHGRRRWRRRIRGRDGTISAAQSENTHELAITDTT